MTETNEHMGNGLKIFTLFFAFFLSSRELHSELAGDDDSVLSASL